MILEKTLLKDLKVKRANESSRILDSKKKRVGKEMGIVYECVVGTAEENQEELDNVFDLIFEEVIRRRGEKKGY